MHDLLTPLRDVIEPQPMVVCADRKYTHMTGTCPLCHGTGSIPDPVLTPLAELIWELRTQGHEWERGTCLNCRTTSNSVLCYIPRTYRSLPELAGAFQHAACVTLEKLVRPHDERIFINIDREVTVVFGNDDAEYIQTITDAVAAVVAWRKEGE